MASADLARSSRTDWVLANPWPWMLGGLGACALSWAMAATTATAGPEERFEWGRVVEGLRVCLVFVGLLGAAAAVTLRLHGLPENRLRDEKASVYQDRLPPAFRSLVLFLLTGLFALLTLGTTFLFLLRVFGLDAIPWKPGHLFLLWLVVAPMSAVAAFRCWNRWKPGTVVNDHEETALLLALAALTAFCGCWGLYEPNNPLIWDSMRVFLAVVVLVALVAAPLVMVGQTARRLVVSLLVLLHFGGIATAVMSAPPTPWVFVQLWTRIYRPYLEFMYLNNAYHFYAPEPGPASFLWFRIFYQDDEGLTRAEWLKIPKIDAKGNHQYSVALEYQRILAVTENTVPTDPPPATFVIDKEGQATQAEWITRRVEHSPGPAGQAPVVVIGKPRPRMIVPFHPFIQQWQQQYQQPNYQSQLLLQSYAYHVCRMAQASHPDWRVRSVKIYRVVHDIPKVASYVTMRLDARDPENHRPYYMGEYDSQGRLISPTGGNEKAPRDPFLYWLLPVLRDNTENPESPIQNYAIKHAGDPHYIYQWDPRKRRHYRVGAADEP